MESESDTPSPLTRKQAVKVALNDPAVKEQLARNPLVAQRRLLYSEGAVGLFVDLATVGFADLDEVGELRRRGVNYKGAVPILLEWLPRVTYLPLAEDIVRTLSVPFAKKEALPIFLTMFEEPPTVEDPMRPATSEPAKEHLRWVFGNGLGIFADASVAGKLIDLARARQYGQARTQIVVNLSKTKDERVPIVLLGLLDDPSVSAFAVQALGQMKYIEARPKIAELMNHSDQNVGNQVKKALKRIDG